MQRHAKEFPRRGGQHATSRTRTTARPGHRCGESNSHLMAFQNTTPQRLTRFTLREAFLALAVVAVFCSLRSWSIAVEDERLIAVAPLVVASMVAALLAMRGAGYAVLFAGAGLASLVAATSWALECVLESPGTSFLRRHPIQAQYSVDAELNAIGVVVITTASTLVGGVSGVVLRFITRWSGQIHERRTS